MLQLDSFEDAEPDGDTTFFRPSYSVDSVGLNKTGFISSTAFAVTGDQSIFYQPLATEPPSVAEIIFEFDSPTTAFGITLFDLASTPPGAIVQIQLDDGPLLPILNLSQQPVAQTRFIGLVFEKPAERVTLIHTVNGVEGDAVLFDDVLFTICPADLNSDGLVDSSDLAILLAAWKGPEADLDGDTTTGSGDLAILLAAWGPC